MKKVTNISIGERVFSIEEDAYSILNNYLESIGEYFEKQESDDEILKDIEYSIADKLNTKKRSLKNAVNLKDVEKIIGELGTLEELTDGDANTPKIPEEKTTKVKQLYRDSENTVIAGVASGIASYFGIDPILVRVAFIIFVFMGGSGIILYLILWIIVPVAKTSSQKLAMKGEVANLENITEYFDEKVKKKVNKSTVRKIINFPFMILGYIFTFLSKSIPFFRIIIGTIITFISGLFIYILTTFFLITLGFGTGFNIDANTLEILKSLEQIANINFILFSAFLIGFIPLFLCLAFGINMIFKRTVMNVTNFIAIFVIWILSLSFLTVSIVQNFNTVESIAEKFGEHVIDDGENFHILIDVDE